MRTQTLSSTPGSGGTPSSPPVWLNGVLLPAAQARIDPVDRGFSLGDGVFETIKAEQGIPLHFDRHYRRLAEGAHVLGFQVPYSEKLLAAAVETVLRAGCPAAGAVRLTLTRGPAPRGVLPPAAPAPTLLITAGPLPATLPPARLLVAATVRRNEYSPLSRIKSLNYGDNILARQEAAAAGFDDALLLNTAGNLAEATAATICLCMDGQWITPRVTDGALPGIARQILLERAALHEVSITATELRHVSAALLINSLGQRRVASIGDMPLDLDAPYPA